MRNLYTLVMMQLKDKIDLSFTKNKKDFLFKSIFFILKFVLMVAICYVIIMVCQKFLGLFWLDELPRVMVLVLTVFFALSLISCTFGLVKTMYFSDDNKVLVTLPINGNIVFISKLLVFYFYELIRSFSLLVPIILAFGLYFKNYIGLGFLLWMWLPMIFYTAMPVIFGALLSIPMHYVMRFFKRVPAISVLLFIGVAVAVVFGLIKLIGVIPENIDLVNFWPQIKQNLQNFLISFQNKVGIISELPYIIIGERQSNFVYSITWLTFGKFMALVGIEALCSFVTFIVTRYFFYMIMRKNFEFSKKIVKTKKKNRSHNLRTTFIIKELRINLRSLDVSLSFLGVYVAVPIMIFLLNKVFTAINTNITGDYMVYAFNILIMTLPLFASNAIIATMFSREGRAGYIKKTKPINPRIALTAKLILNLALSVPSVICSTVIFSLFNDISNLNIFLLTVGIICLNYGHIFYSATLDIMNPQNEQYATTGEAINNKNENLATVVAFIASAVYAFFGYILFTEATLYGGNLNVAFIKLFCIGVVVFVLALVMFIKKVNLYYAEI